jgi:hypothetical protein
MATTSVISGNATKNNGATVLYGGNIDSSNTVTNAPGKSIVGAEKLDQRVPGPSATAETAAVNSSGNWGKMGDDWIMKSGVTEYIAGVANDALWSGGARYKGCGPRTPKKRTTRRTVQISSWDAVTGTPTYESPAVTTDDFGEDHEANSTRALPGEYCMMETGASPSTGDYPEKT